MKEYTKEFLELLSERYPSIGSASRAIVTLKGKLSLPKEREHFISDIHGEYDAFSFVAKSGSGTIDKLLRDAIGERLTPDYRRELWRLVTYPTEMIERMADDQKTSHAQLKRYIVDLIRLFYYISGKYTHEESSSFFPEEYSALLEELFADKTEDFCDSSYFNALLDAAIETDSAPEIITALASSIQRGAVDRLHVIGDIFDRGKFPHKIIEDLIAYKRVDIQWGNHDILWMGAASGSEACIANVIRNALRYETIETLEEGYGIHLMPLVSFALDAYADDDAAIFAPKNERLSQNEKLLLARMHKAIAITQFKLEGQIIKRRPQYHMNDRLLLEAIDYENGCVRIDGEIYPLLDTSFPTIDPRDPYRLSEGEARLIERLKSAFLKSPLLQRHIRFLFTAGGMYKAHNGNLLYHGCITMNADGTFEDFIVEGEGYSGKAYYDRLDRIARQGYFSDNPEVKQYGEDTMWFLWCGNRSPLFGKNKITTFERYFIADPKTHKEERNAYYDLRDNEEIVKKILREFGLNPEQGIIVNGHVPVKVKKGERPVKANGKLLVIDGGFSKAYRAVTGIAGYTLVSGAQALILVEHRPFESPERIVEGANAEDAVKMYSVVEYGRTRTVADTDKGKEIMEKIEAISALAAAYRLGEVKEKISRV